MKAVILNTEKEHSNILCDDGTFRKIKKENWHETGQTFQYKPPIIKILSKVAMLVFIIAGITLITAYSVPYRTMAVDINPSISMRLNIFDYILSAKALNEDGNNILEDNNITNKRPKKAIASIVDSAVKEGYLQSDTENMILISYNKPSKSHNEEYINDIVEYCEDKTKDLNINADIQSDTFGRKIVKQAKDLKASPGKIVLLNKLQQVKKDASYNDIKDMSVKNIMAVINESKKTQIAKKINGKDKQKADGNKNKEKDKNGSKNTTNSHKDNNDKVDNNKVSAKPQKEQTKKQTNESNFKKNISAGNKGKNTTKGNTHIDKKTDKNDNSKTVESNKDDKFNNKGNNNSKVDKPVSNKDTVPQNNKGNKKQKTDKPNKPDKTEQKRQNNKNNKGNKNENMSNNNKGKNKGK